MLISISDTAVLLRIVPQLITFERRHEDHIWGHVCTILTVYWVGPKMSTGIDLKTFQMYGRKKSTFGGLVRAHNVRRSDCRASRAGCGGHFRCAVATIF